MHIYAEFHSLHSALLPRNRNELEVRDLLLNGVKEKEASSDSSLTPSASLVPPKTGGQLKMSCLHDGLYGVQAIQAPPLS